MMSTMLRVGKLGMLGAATLGATLGLSTPRRVGAVPMTSPSVIAAAQLKYHPPRGWINYYLGDDRYKIKGGTWKVVSTENDRYYYPAWAPEMLSQVRQAPGIVIGFASAHDAEEAGYLRSKYPMESPTLGLDFNAPRPVAPPPSAAGGLNAFAIPQEGMEATVNSGNAKRVVLSDGISTALLPKGWTHFKQVRDTTGAQRAGGNVRVDIFAPGTPDMQSVSKGTARMVAFAFMEMPGMNAEVMFSKRGLNGLNAAMNRSSSVNSGRSRFIENTKAGSFGNISGIRMSFPAPDIGKVSLVMGGRGSKVYMMMDLSHGVKGAQGVVNSFRGK